MRPFIQVEKEKGVVLRQYFPSWEAALCEMYNNNLSGGEKMRIQVSIGDEIGHQVEKYAAMLGVTKSALCATFIGQGVVGYNKSFDFIDGAGAKMRESLIEEMKKETVTV